MQKIGLIGMTLILLKVGVAAEAHGADALAAARCAWGAGGSFAGLSRKCAGSGGVESKMGDLNV